MLGVMLSCHYLDIYSNFCAGTLALHFALGPTHFASGPAQASGQMVAPFAEMEGTGRGQFLFLGGGMEFSLDHGQFKKPVRHPSGAAG